MTTSQPVSDGTRRICFYSCKGGQGTSVVAAAFATFAARLGATVTLRSTNLAELAALLGVSQDAARDGAVDAVAGLRVASLTSTPTTPVVVDDLATGGPDDDPYATSVLVIRTCFLALRAAAVAAKRPHGIVVITEPGRALSGYDITDVLDVPLLAELPLAGSVARAVDSGLLVAHVVRDLPEPTPLLRLEALACELLELDAVPRPTRAEVASPPAEAGRNS